MINVDLWDLPPVFGLLQKGGRIAPEEMARTFNCGVGMALVVAADEAVQVSGALEAAGETVLEIGRIEQGQRGCTVSGSAGTWNSDGDWSATHNA
jgi:phosphoribosylformylglycinamidine cyclo-ligase